MRSILLILFLLLFSIDLFAQRDTIFWFVAPDVSFEHEDRPVNFRVSTEDESADVLISQPANPDFTPVRLIISANSTRTHRIDGDRISQVENSDPDKVLNKGFLIESTSLVTAYYDVGEMFNIDIFTLKGRNALGQEFVVPGQNRWSNNSYTDSHSSFEIVATENNTIVEYIPTVDVVGHAAGEKVRFRLNRGETYSARAISGASSSTLAGTIVTSNRPIAITLQDDSIVARSGGCRDLTGDQLVPVGVVGMEYIVQPGKLFQDETVFITTTEGNTTIRVNGNLIGGTFGARELVRIDVSGSLFIQASEPIYLMQYTGIGCEIGAALLPSINCTGSNQIGFSRSGDQEFTMNIIVPTGGEGGFELNGRSGFIEASSFSTVPGTNGEWQAASIDFDVSDVGPGTGNTIRNGEASFQLGFLDGGEFSGTRFGYLSNFSSLFIGDDITLCAGQSRKIFPKGDADAVYEWSDGSTGAFIEVFEAGKYWVKTTNSAGCVLSDTLEVFVELADFLTLPDQLVGCTGDTVFIDPGDHFNYLWSDGSTDRILKVLEPGEYAVTVTNIKGCEDSAMVPVIFEVRPSLDLGADLTTCIRDSITLSSNITGADRYQWVDGSAELDFSTDLAGIYWLEIEKGACVVRDSVIVMNHPSPALDSIKGSKSVCPGIFGVEYTANEVSDLTYTWSVVGGTLASPNGSNTILIDWGDTNANGAVNLLETNQFGCRSEAYAFDVRVNRFLETETPQGLDSLCANRPVGISYFVESTNGSNYSWNINGGTIVQGQGTNQVDVNWDGPGTHTIQVDESSATQLDVCFGSSEVLEVLVFNDTTNVELHAVSVHPAFDDDITLAWTLEDAGMKVDELLLYRRSFSESWTLLVTLDRNATRYTDVALDTENSIYEYRLDLINGCDELVESTKHNSMVLTAIGDEENNTITLNWNPYEGWPSGVDHYEILRKLDDENNFIEVGRVDPTASSVVMENASDGFVHDLRVMAVPESSEFASLSNTVQLEFEHEITIPNVFTPNGDNINETFEIPKIELYQDNELRVFSREGKEVFRATGYASEWNGVNLPSGQYFYVLTLNSLQRIIKGSIFILK